MWNFKLVYGEREILFKGYPKVGGIRAAQKCFKAWFNEEKNNTQIPIHPSTIKKITPLTSSIKTEKTKIWSDAIEKRAIDRKIKQDQTIGPPSTPWQVEQPINIEPGDIPIIVYHNEKIKRKTTCTEELKRKIDI
jgi:hypothetical protein